ncbi:MAG: 1-acyl-sn-glycerol-3-phosphate acyltransferase [Proteobacteria bacterium]|nr:1-acyl-sn-glycerol-3-phosphate acyltransferase [Pseudomonadota bacterium]
MKNIFQVYVWLVVYPVSWLLTIVVAISVTIVSMLGGAKFAGRYIAKFWGKLILWITPVRVQLLGIDNIQIGESYVVVSNHQSIYDVLAVYGYLPLDFKWVMKAELRRMPFVGYACYKMGHIFVERKNKKSSARSLNQGVDRLKGGFSVFFFPEGTRVKDQQIINYKKGAYRMAKELNLPILPVTISGSDKVMPSESFQISPGTITITLHPAISIKDVEELSVSELILASRTTIESAL